MRTLFAGLFMGAMAAGLPSDAWALTVLKGREAAAHVGDSKAHFIGKNYTFEMLKRSHRDAMHGRFSDALLFNADGGLFEYLRRKDVNHLILIDSPNGREEEPVTEEAWRKEIQNTLSDDNREPVVYLDDKGKELAVVFIGSGTQIRGKMTDSGRLQIELTVEGGKDNRGRRRMGI